MHFTINTVGFVFILLGCIIVGIVIGYFITRKLFKSELEKNPPISEAMIKAMYRSMGVTPSQARVNQTMKAIKESQKSGK
jgi:uncharacterized protein YneF (UPF0154 family)